MSPDNTNPTPDARPGRQSSLDPEITDALTELATRLEKQGVQAKVWVHDGMTAVMTHRDGDTTATVDEALVEGSDLIEKLTAEIAAEQGLPHDWLGRLGTEGPPTHPGRLATAYEFSLHRRQTRNQTG